MGECGIGRMVRQAHARAGLGAASQQGHVTAGQQAFQFAGDPGYLCFPYGRFTLSLGLRANTNAVPGAIYDGFRLCDVHDPVFRTRHRVPEGLRSSEVKVATMLGSILLIIISILLCGYLFYALLKPEKF